MKRTIYLLLASSLLLFACGEDDSTPTDKGAEENALTDGKEDSFFRPTNHGPASFTRANQATIDEDQTFHAWTFELTGEATLELKTEITTRNLDTVMYLYHRENEEDSWGRYIKKNDDHRGNMWSQIDGGFEAGLYRVIVKPFKTSMSGSFALLASCEGDGCPATGGECSAEHSALPLDTGFGDGCAESILEVVTSELKFESQLDIPVDQKCDLNPLAAKAVDYYVSYWDELVGFEDAFGGFGAPGESVRLYVEEYTHDRGTVIWIDANADEDRMQLVFDTNGELLALYQANQSPDNRFYCGQERDWLAEFPTCWSNSIDPLRRTSDATSGEVDTITVEEAGVSRELDSDLITAIFHFTEAHEIGDQEELTYELLTWRDSLYFGAEVSLTWGEVSATYWIADTELVAVSDNESTRYLCEYIDI